MRRVYRTHDTPRPPYGSGEDDTPSTPTPPYRQRDVQRELEKSTSRNDPRTQPEGETRGRGPWVTEVGGPTRDVGDEGTRPGPTPGLSVCPWVLVLRWDRTFSFCLRGSRPRDTRVTWFRRLIRTGSGGFPRNGLRFTTPKDSRSGHRGHCHKDFGLNQWILIAVQPL